MDIELDMDFLLLQKMRMGDEKALEAFVKKYYPRILKYCRTHIDNDSYAEDMAQETFAHFFRTLKQYWHYGKAANYLYRIAANVCHDYYRKQKEILLEEFPDCPNGETEDLELRLDVQMALNSLTEELREVADLFFIQEQKQKDIARILGIGLPLVKYRIRKARERLSAYFGKEGP